MEGTGLLNLYQEDQVEAYPLEDTDAFYREYSPKMADTFDLDLLLNPKPDQITVQANNFCQSFDFNDISSVKPVNSSHSEDIISDDLPNSIPEFQYSSEEDLSFQPTSPKQTLMPLFNKEQNNHQRVPNKLKKKTPLLEDPSSGDEDEEISSTSQPSNIKEPKKTSFIRKCLESRTHFSELLHQVNNHWSVDDAKYKKLGKTIRDLISGIYTQHIFAKPQDQRDPVIQLVLHQLYSIIIPNYDPNNPTTTDERGKKFNLILMEIKRSDQYVKKFWSKLKLIIYSSFKSESIKRAEALNQISEKFGLGVDSSTFENLFGSNVKHGLKKTTIEFILNHPKLFKEIFSQKNFTKAIVELQDGLELDCETNIINKVEIFLQKPSPNFEFLLDQISDERKFKKPFTYLEINIAAQQFLDKFIKRIKTVQGISSERKPLLEKTLNDLKTSLLSTAKTNNWLVPFKHKKSEIISFLKA
jgi:hypothetical protein